MSVKVKSVLEREPAMLRDTYVKTLMELTEQDPRHVALDADLSSSLGIKPFVAAYPDRFFNCGICEANMVGVAAGLASMGFMPWAHTFGIFASRRVADQVFMSVAYGGQNVRIVGTDPGVTAAFNGGTHMPFEDMGMLRTIPQMTLVEPTDSVQLAAAMRQMAQKPGAYYLRLQRKQAVSVFEEGSDFQIGKGIVLQDGTDVTLIASGILVAPALEAAKMLAEKGISVRVVNLHTWKPLDEALVETCARETGAIVTCENHNTLCGLGSAVCETVAQTCPVPVMRIGSGDQFGEVGPEDYLRGRFHMNAIDIAVAAEKAMAKKKK